MAALALRPDLNIRSVPLGPRAIARGPFLLGTDIQGRLSIGLLEKGFALR